MDYFLNTDLKIMDSSELQIINAGDQSDYDFGYKVGNSVKWFLKELWYSTLGARPVY